MKKAGILSGINYKQPVYPLYDINNSCSKCGQNGASTKHDHTGTGRDMMIRICQNCGYYWYERPLDSTEQKG